MTTAKQSLLEAAKAVLDASARNHLRKHHLDALRQAVQDAEVYTPMTIEEHQRIWGKSYPENPVYNFNDAIDWADEITLERAVIERLGLRWPNSNG